MTKFQCLRCEHLDIENPDKAICTGCYEAHAIEQSVDGADCPHYMRQLYRQGE